MQENLLILFQRIATILCQELVPRNSIIMITEALDTTFDAFGEDGHCDGVLTSSGLANILSQFPPHLKAKVGKTFEGYTVFQYICFSKFCF